MAFLPIVEREVRAAARQPQWYLWRLMPVILAVGLMLPQYLSFFVSGNLKVAGYQCFSYLAWLMEFMAIMAAWPACNGILKERREGTLGLLFLTDLGGLDVILGKSTYFALGGAMVLVGMAPVLAITLLMGGVTGGEVARSAIAIINTLFFSISIGLWSASRFTAPLKVGKMIFFWMVMLAVLPACMNIDALKFIPFVLASPFETLLLASDAKYVSVSSDYWLSLGIVQIESWLFLFMAHRAIGNTWRDPLGEAWMSRKTKCRTKTALGDKEPIAWLAERQPWQKAIIWTAVSLALFIKLWPALLNAGLGARRFQLPFYGAIHPLCYYGSTLLFTWAACRFLAENRANGSMELLSVTPLGTIELIRRYWQGLQNQLRLPLVLIVTGELVSFSSMLFAVRGRMEYSQYVMFFVSMFMEVISRLLVIYAICWVGMYLACVSRSLFAAVAKTFCFFIIVPKILQTISVSFFIAFQANAPSQWMVQAAYMLSFFALSLGIYAGGIYWARKKLLAMRPHESALNRLHIFKGLNQDWLGSQFRAIRNWQAD